MTSSPLDGWVWPQNDGVRLTGAPRIGKRSGRVTTPCPNGCDFEVDTDRASLTLDTGACLRYLGVPCDVCGKTFTVEQDYR